MNDMFGNEKGDVHCDACSLFTVPCCKYGILYIVYGILHINLVVLLIGCCEIYNLHIFGCIFFDEN